MEYVRKKLSELKPYENNPRINDEAVDDVAAEHPAVFLHRTDHH